jgi:NAD(P)-dependent dehydrogenase (short-subunit alcohol dehydrogenase family)
MDKRDKLSGCTAIVTGANRGLGLEIARRFVAEGADVALGARDAALLENEAGALAGASHGRKVIWRCLDVVSPVDTAAFAEWAIAELGSVDVLVNNAAVYGPMGDVDTVDWDLWVGAIHVNLMGSVLMCRAILPHMKQRRRGKIVQLSGGGATNPLPGISAYACSKAAIVRFAETLALETQPFGIEVNSIAPGALNTRMLDEVIEAGPDRVGQGFYDRALEQMRQGGIPLDKGAELALFLASKASNGITGRLISAVWDRYEEWPRHIEALSKSDLYTLRRIAGRDRGQDWGDR